MAGGGLDLLVEGAEGLIEAGDVDQHDFKVAAVFAPQRQETYTAAKGGVAALTRSMAAEYAPHRIRVNAIAPSVTLTPRIKARMEASGGDHKLAPLHLLGLLEPSDVAHMAVYLASDESCRVTGQILSVDSGASIA